MHTGHAETLRPRQHSLDAARALLARSACGRTARAAERCTAEVPPGWVARPALVRSLLDARDVPLALIVAPPGYGKSTLLREWAQHDDRHFVWLARAQIEHLSLLIRRLRRRRPRFVVIVDDAHLVAPDTLRAGVEAAMAELPASSTLVLASRTELELPIGTLRAHRMLRELRTSDLAMDGAEAAILFDQMGAGLDPGEVAALAERTEGWPAALYLAALTLRDDPEGVASFGGQHHVVSEYLAEEVLDAMPDDLLAFAVRAAVLDELSGPICDAVLRTRGSAAQLDQLVRANPLLLAVDSAHRQYRWHALVREALEDRLQRLDPELDKALHLRASAWHAEHGDAERAIEHATAGDDAALTGELLWPNILAYLTGGRRALVRRWLDRFGTERVASGPSLALAAAYSALAAGDVGDAQRWSLTATAARERCGPGADRAPLETALAVIDAIGAHDGPQRMGAIVAAAAEAEPPDSPWLPLCSLLGAIATYLQGDRAAAERQLDESIRLSSTGLPAVVALCLAERAIVAVDCGDWDLAAELTDRAIMLVEEWDLVTDPLVALVFAATAASRAHHGRIDEAKRDLRHAVDLLASLGDFVPWYGAQARILLAHASLSLADAVAARTLLAEASRCARRIPGAVVFSSWFERAWAYMDTIAETSLAGPSSLTIAELRILRFLPSHRSFREIAAQLGVSSNTVKTQAHAVYRKLGAASRSEAVAMATEAGLLGG